MVNPRFAVWTLSVIALLSILIESDYYLLQEIQGDVQWVPEESCGYPKNYSQPVYVVQYYRWLGDNVQKYYVYTKTIFKYLPAVMLPPLTIGLVIVLKNIRKSRKKLQVSSEEWKQMRSASVNVLMIGLALSDMIYFTIEAIDVVMNFYPYDECTPPYSYVGTVILFFKTNLYNIFRRLSPWIGVVMAFTRLLVSSYPFNVSIGKMANPNFAVWSLLMSLVMSTFMESDLYALREIATFYTWHPGKSCGYPTNYTQPIYQVQFYSWMNDFTYLANRFDNAKVAVKFLPTVILPFLTIGLVKVLKNIKISKQRLHTNSNNTTYQTTRLVTIMTCCLVITEVSTGIYSLSSTILRTTLSTATVSAFS
ncbi:unnamed protein product [Caenorhabditis brenneri]